LIRIAIFTPTFYPRIGGAEYVADRLARGFERKGHAATVVTPQLPDNDDAARPYAVYRYRKPPAPEWWPERVGRALRAAQAGGRFDVVLAFYGQPTGFAAIRERERTGIPVVVRSPGGDLYRGSKTRRRPHRWRRVVAAYRQADATVAPSCYIERLLNEILPSSDRVWHIPNGVDPGEINQPATRPSDFTRPEPYALCLGNLRPQKGFAEAIEAFAQRGSALPGLQLVLAGAGPAEPALRDLARARGVSQSIHFLGERLGNDKRWLLQNCEFVIMPSHEEAFGNVALEALAAGVPLICSDISALDRFCRHSTNGFRFRCGCPDSLAHMLVEALGRSWPDLAAYNRAVLANYQWDRVVDQYLQLFREL